MNPDRHCPAPGSSAYYTIRFAPREHRQALQALYEVLHAMQAVHREITDPGVAEAKLNWWREEIGLAARGSARHPATLRLQSQRTPSAQPQDALWHALQSFAAAIEAQAQQSRYLDETALLRQVHLTANSVAAAVSSILAPAAHWSDAPLGPALQAAHLTRLIQRLGQEARRGYLPVPIGDLQQFDVKAHEILKGDVRLQEETRFQQLMRHQAARVRGIIPVAQAGLADQPRALQRVGLIALAHSGDLLNALEAAEFAVLNQHIGLTPLRKLWLAWTAR